MKTSADGRGWRHRLRWRHALAPMTLIAAELLTAPVAGAQHPDHSGSTAASQPVFLEALLVLGTAVVAGVALLRPFTGEPVLHRVAWWAASLVLVASLLSMIFGAGGVLAMFLHSVLTVAVVPLLSRRIASIAGGFLLTALLLLEAIHSVSTMDAVVGVLYRVAAIALLGVAATVLTTAVGSRVARARCLAPVAFLAVLAVAAAGAVQVLTPSPDDPRPGVALVRHAELGGGLPVLVAPHRPGPNLVHVGDTGSGVVRVGVDPGHMVVATPRRGAAGKWALVRFPEGSGELLVERDGHRTSLDIDAGHGPPGPPSISGTDGPECADMALGGAVASAVPSWELRSCPADSLSPADEAHLRRAVDFLADRGIRTLALVGDTSPRSRAATEAVRDAASRRRLSVLPEPGREGAVVVLSGWDTAAATISDLAARQSVGGHAAGTYVAPWLLSAPVIKGLAGTLIPLPFDPSSENPVHYEIALARRFPGQSPTSSGYRGWLAERGIQATERTRLYAASLVSVMPSGTGHDHGGAGGWLPGGTVVPVTGPLE